MKKLITMLMGFIITINTQAQDLPDPLCITCMEIVDADSADIYLFEALKWNKQHLLQIFITAAEVPSGGTVDHTNVFMTRSQINSVITTPNALQDGAYNFFIVKESYYPSVLVINETGKIVQEVNLFSFKINEKEFVSGMGRVFIPKRPKLKT
jgi:hypothetical protein